MAKITFSVVYLLIATVVLSCGCTGSSTQSPSGNLTPTTSNSANITYPTPVAVSYSSLTADEKKLIDIAMNDDRLKTELSGREYVITSAVMTGHIPSPPVEDGLVSIEVLNPDGSLDYNLALSIDLQNNTVSFINREKPAPVF